MDTSSRKDPSKQRNVCMVIGAVVGLVVVILIRMLSKDKTGDFLGQLGGLILIVTGTISILSFSYKTTPMYKNKDWDKGEQKRSEWVDRAGWFCVGTSLATLVGNAVCGIVKNDFRPWSIANLVVWSVLFVSGMGGMLFLERKFLRYCILWDTITGMEIQQTDQFRKWLRRLRDRDAKARIIARIRQCGLAGRPVGDMHPVGNGVNELRFFFGPGYRVYFAQKGDRIMLLLAGGDKTGQDRAIKEAQEMLESLIKEGQW